MLLVLHFLLHRANRIEVTLMKGLLSFGAPNQVKHFD